MRVLFILVVGLTLGCSGIFGPPELSESEKPEAAKKIKREKRQPGKADRDLEQANPKAVAKATSGLATVWGEVIQTPRGWRQPECEGRPLVVTLTQSRVRVGSGERAEFFDLLDGHRSAGRVNLTVEDHEGVSFPASFRWVDRNNNIGQWDLPNNHHLSVMPKGQLPTGVPCPVEEPEEVDVEDTSAGAQ